MKKCIHPKSTHNKIILEVSPFALLIFTNWRNLEERESKKSANLDYRDPHLKNKTNMLIMTMKKKLLIQGWQVKNDMDIEDRK